MKYRPTGGNKQIKYLFSVLTEHVKWFDEGAQGKPQVDKTQIINYENITIEHIDAQSPGISAIYDEEERQKLKNLTLLTPGENDHVANKQYADKKPTYINSDYKLNIFFSDVVQWDTETSSQWEKHLIDMACKIFVV